MTHKLALYARSNFHGLVRKNLSNVPAARLWRFHGHSCRQSDIKLSEKLRGISGTFRRDEIGDDQDQWISAQKGFSARGKRIVRKQRNENTSIEIAGHRLRSAL